MSEEVGGALAGLVKSEEEIKSEIEEAFKSINKNKIKGKKP